MRSKVEVESSWSWSWWQGKGKGKWGWILGGGDRGIGERVWLVGWWKDLRG